MYDKNILQNFTGLESNNLETLCQAKNYYDDNEPGNLKLKLSPYFSYDSFIKTLTDKKEEFYVPYFL